MDIDSDGDGMPDSFEYKLAVRLGMGDFRDRDGDGFPNWYDVDSDNDTVKDSLEGYPYYAEPIMNTLSAPVVFVCGALIHSITKVRHFFACGDFAILTLVHLGLLGDNHRWWAVATPRCLLELRNDEGDHLFDTQRMCRIVGHCDADKVSQFKVQTQQ